MVKIAREKYYRELDKRCSKEPLYWLCNHTRTRDDRWQQKSTEPFAKFPMMPYFPPLFECLLEEKRLFIPKSRDMRITWCVMGYLVWQAQFHGPQHIMVQTQKQDKVIDLISGIDVPGYTRTLYERQDDWLKDRHPTTRPPGEMAGTIFTWENGSKIEGVPSGANQFRQPHPSIVFFDEAAFLDDWLGSYQAALPVAGQIISVSSAAPSAFGDMVMKIQEESILEGNRREY